MVTCPKCGSTHISGPTYERNAYGFEHLRYRCDRCGYSETTGTLDQDRDEQRPGAAIIEATRKLASR